MATMGDRNGNVQQGSKDVESVRSGGMGGNVGMGDVGSPISNDAYNVITALQAKLEGLEAYRKYQKDGTQEIWQQLSQADIQCVTKLVDELETLVKNGKLRPQKSSKA